RFNPRTRAGCDDSDTSEIEAKLEVSIHAPVRGATSGDVLRQMELFVSIHAPVRGATSIMANVIIKSSVSIHAPVRGATVNISN
ncbi:MAG: hypothetical protein PWR27_254, partial [Petroclostridium sp.]|nr:hypothetical protein [Petroclostridium sp.]